MEDSFRQAFQRLELLVGADGLARLREARVAVFGLGAVGSFAVEALARSGVGHLRLVDFDEVRPSNLNRQLLALTDTIGRRKAELAAERVLRINPEAHVDVRVAFFCREEADDLLAPPLDWVVDAIDSVGPKVALISEAVRRGYRVVSAMGAASRTDPTRIRVGPLSETAVCPLARRVRKDLNKLGLDAGVVAVWSDEPPAPLPPPGEVLDREETLVRGRERRTLPSMAPLPGIFGLVAANVVIRGISGR